MTEPTLIVYDWNGCLFDDVAISVTCSNQVLARYGFPLMTADSYRACFDIPISRLYIAHGLPQETIERVMPDLHAAFHTIYKPHENEQALRAGTLESLEALHQKGLRKIILSNHMVDAIQTQLDRTQISAYFETVLAHPHFGSLVTQTPKGERLRAFMAEQNCVPERTVIIGDSPEEVRIARDLGLISVALTGGHASRERLQAEEPDYLITGWDALPALLEERGLLS